MLRIYDALILHTCVKIFIGLKVYIGVMGYPVTNSACGAT